MRGRLLEVLQRPELRDYVTEESLGEQDLRSAIEALMEGEFDHEAVVDAIASLFDVLPPAASARGRPWRGRLRDLKGPSLEGFGPALGASGGLWR